MELLSQRDTELTKIYRYSGRGFFFAYMAGVLGFYVMRGRTPYFRDVVKHSVLSVSGMFGVALMSEKVAAEMYYNKLLIQLADKYNFKPEEVMELQRNLNQYYIKKDREADLESE
mmetsp:Transcript_11648/g.8507  ORF Transcript_11648/g.8507 Transcript_11648/m.8507 type:complete len:115 (+) Transcript_11648:125-469(+)